MNEQKPSNMVRIIPTDSLLIVEVYDDEAYRLDDLYKPLRALVRVVLYGMLSPCNAAIFGSRLVEWLEPDMQELGWRSEEHFVDTSIHVWQGLEIAGPQSSWFFRSCQPGLPAQAFDQALVTDSLCILCNYRGPEQVNSLVSSLPTTATEHDIALRLLEFCDIIALSDNDGCVLRVIGKQNSFHRGSIFANTRT